MKKTLLTMLSFILLFGLASAQEADQAAMPTTPDEAMWQLGGTLSEGVETVPGAELTERFRNLRTTIEAAGDTDLQAVATASTAVEDALAAEPFDQATLVQALQELALAMRAAAEAGDASLMVELASLVDQTADYIQNEGFTPRMEVDAP